MVKYGAVLNQKGFLTLLGLLIVILIIGILFSTVLRTYFQIPSLKKEGQEPLSSPSISSVKPKQILDSTRQKLQDAQKKILEREKQIINR